MGVEPGNEVGAAFNTHCIVTHSDKYVDKNLKMHDRSKSIICQLPGNNGSRKCIEQHYIELAANIT